MERSRKPKGYTPTRAFPIINRLRQERIIAGLTQIDLATAIGYCHQNIYRLETGSLRPSVLYLIHDYADFLGYDLVLVPKGKPR